MIFAGANVTTQALQLLTEAPRDHPYPWLPMTVWPSGHVCAGTTLAICVVLAAPTQLRPFLAGLGAIGVVGTSYAVVAAGGAPAQRRPRPGCWSRQRGRASPRPRCGGASGRARGVALAAAAGAAVTALGFAAIVVEVSPPSRLLEATVAGAVAMAVCGAVRGRRVRAAPRALARPRQLGAHAASSSASGSVRPAAGSVVTSRVGPGRVRAHARQRSS